jgi:hypothetical protein
LLRDSLARYFSDELTSPSQDAVYGCLFFAVGNLRNNPVPDGGPVAACYRDAAHLAGRRRPAFFEIARNSPQTAMLGHHSRRHVSEVLLFLPQRFEIRIPTQFFERHPQTFLLLKGSATRAPVETDARGCATGGKINILSLPDAVLTSTTK